MNSLRVLYHMARADLLERMRRYSFLITLGLALWLGYEVATGQLVLVLGSNYRGIINSAWVGGLMAVMTNFFLGLFGFYIVKGSINRDYQTGVGQIMATTLLNRPLYTLGKWLSNSAVLGVMVVILMVATVVMQLLYREDPIINLWTLLAPFLLLVLPFLAFMAALAVLFETIDWLRGSLGNVIYFFLYISSFVMLIFRRPILDFTGMGIVDASMGQAAKALYPDYTGGSDITWLVPEYQTFQWDGLAWTAEIVFARLALVFAAIGVAILAAVFFDRFNPSRELHIRKKRSDSVAPEPRAFIEAKPVSNVHLTPIADTQARFRFDALFIAELRLLLKGQHWWWYAIALGLIIGQLFSPLDITRYLLVAAWAWLILIISELGCRESRYNTCQIVFSAPRPLANQLPAVWLSALTVTAMLGSGAFVHFFIAFDLTGLLVWMAGALFIPSLALALGVLTGSSKTFEVVYVLWIYMALQKYRTLDFVGMTPDSPWYIYAPLAIVLLALAFFARQWQLKSKSTFG